MGCTSAKELSDTIDATDCECDYSECKYVSRLREMLNIYNNWVNKKTKSKTGIYECFETQHHYSIVMLLEDYHHLIDQHLSSADFENVYDFFCNENNKCTIDSCQMMSRNNRDRSNTQRQHDNPTGRTREQLYHKHNDPMEVICQQILDQIHSYIFHTFDAGFKLTKKEIEEMDMTENMDNDNNDNDSDFSNQLLNKENIRRQHIRKIIQRKRNNAHELRNSNKFTSNVGSEAEIESKNRNKMTDNNLDYVFK
eukprot:314316_1